MSTHREKIDQAIELEKKSNFLNHFLSNFRFSEAIIVEKNDQEYKLWKSDRWSSFMYSVFYIEFNSEGTIIKIHEEINPVGKLIKYLFLGLIFVFFGYQIYDTVMYPPDGFYTGYFIALGAFFVLFYAIYKGVGYIRRITKNNMIDELKVTIGLETKESLQERERMKSEWTGRKILTRLILYPLCLFLIFVSVYLLFIDTGRSTYKGISSSFYALGLSLTYLIADVFILIKKRK